MSSKIFEELLNNHIEIFVEAFKNLSRDLFTKTDELYHSGEFGMYRELVANDFLKFISPKNLEFGTGFLINAFGERSNQIDIVIFEPEITPLLKTLESQRFFPVESVSAIGEIKSKLDKSNLKKAIHKLAKNKMLRDEIEAASIYSRKKKGNYNPKSASRDLMFSFLICEQLDFDLRNFHLEIPKLFPDDIEQRFWPNMILSLKDGLIMYYKELDEENIEAIKQNEPTFKQKAGDRIDIFYPTLKGVSMKVRFVRPVANPYVHLKKFASYFF